MTRPPGWRIVGGGGMSERLLFLSNLFPDASEPIRGLDNATLLQALIDAEGWDVRSLALRPRLSLRAPGTLSDLAPRAGDERLGPEYVGIRYLPKVGSRWNDGLVAADLAPAFARTVAAWRPDIVLATWLYPDGCAAATLCQQAGLPLVLITQGTDTHGYLRDPVRRRKIVQAVAASRATICRSADLGRLLVGAGAPPERLKTVYNGVDTAIFRLRDRQEARREVGIDPEGPVLLFVGNLLPVKNPLFLIRAVAGVNRQRRSAGLAPARLYLIGDGPMRPTVTREIADQDMATTVTLLGRRPPVEVAAWMAAADRLCLTSHNEGFPNVILEALACGLPVVSTRVGGIGEKIDRPACGQLVTPGDEAAYEAALLAALADPSSRESLTDGDPGWPAAARAYGEILRTARLAVG